VQFDLLLAMVRSRRKAWRVPGRLTAGALAQIAFDDLFCSLDPLGRRRRKNTHPELPSRQKRAVSSGLGTLKRIPMPKVRFFG